MKRCLAAVRAHASLRARKIAGPSNRGRAAAAGAATAVAIAAVTLAGGGADVAESARHERVEDVSKRTATSKTFRNGDGSLTTALYAGPVHFRAADGSHQPIDSRIVRRSAGAEGLDGAGGASAYAYENAANGFSLRFKDRLEDAFMQFGAGGERFSLSMLGGAARPAKTSGGAIEFAGVKPKVDLRYDLSATGAKESLVLHGRSAPRRYRFLLETAGDPRAIRARPTGSGGWRFFVGAQGVPAFALERPSASEFKRAPDGAADAALTAPMGADNARLDVRRARGGFMIELAVDRRWLRAKQRNFPVVVDPTISFQPGDSNSLTMQGDCPTCWAWEGGYIEVGTKTDSVLRGAVKFDVGQIPPTATVSNATMRLESSPHDCIITPSTNNGADCELQGHQVDLHRMTAAWSGSSKTQDIQFEPTAAQSFTIPVGSTTAEAWTPNFNVTGDVADWVAGTKVNNGWLLKRSEEPYGASGPIFMGVFYKGPQQHEPRLEVTYTADGVRLSKPTTLHSNGAELSWSRFDGSTGNAFSRYEVHRSETAGFTPAESTRLTTISDAGVTEFRDTTAAPNRAFSYKVVTNGQPSVEQRVTLPADGKGTITYQGAQGEGTSTFIQDLGTGTGCENFGRSDRLVVGGRDDYTNDSSARALLAFDVHDIPAGAAVDSATLRLWTEGKPSIDTTVNIHRATRAWREGSGYHGEGGGFYKPVCTGDGASWKLSDGATLWSGNGGDFDATVVDSASHAANVRSAANFDVAPIVRDWASGAAANFGFLVKAADETTFANGLYYASDDHPPRPADRPTLTVTYADGSRSQGPQAAIGRPAGGDRVKGTVTVEATAIDDRRVDGTELLVDGVVKASDATAPYSYSWDTTAAANGSRSLTVRASDDVGNQTTSSAVSVDVSNSATPTTAITYPSTTYQTQVKGHAPAAYWRLGETSGTTAADASGNSRPGTYRDAYTLGLTGLVNGDTDKAVQLRTANKAGYFDVTGLSGQLGNALTAEALVQWSAPSSTNTYNRVLARNWGSSGGWLLAVRKDSSGVNQAYFAINKSGSVTEAKAAVTPGRIHLAGTYDGSTLRLFVNGAEAASAALASAPLNTSASVIAGDIIASDITVDEAAVYGAKLNAYELRSHWEVANERDPTIGGQAKVTATAGDDGTVEKVEFYVDGNLFGTDTAAPYDATLDTQSATMPIYDGAHALTTKAYDDHAQVTESSPFNVVVDNAGKSRYVAELSSTAVPAAVDYDPSAATQQKHGVDVTVTNRSTETWSATDVVLRYRWFSPDPPPDGPTITSGPDVELGSALAPNASATKTVMVEPPQLPDGVDKAQYRLQFDLYEKSATRWFSERGNKPVENPVIVNKTLLTALGLERWLHYDGESLGAGMTHLVNVANGNSIVRWSPFSAPGRGLSTNVDLTYNALEKKSESPVGNNFSLSISSLSRFGNPIDVHPNKSDEIAGRANRFVELTDGDGTTHRFIGKQHTDGTIYWEEPDGVHLYLWNPTGGDPARKWAFTRPDDVTFFYDADGYPTSVEDRNGNKLTFTLEDTPPGEDPGGPKRRITKVTDAAGQGATPAPNRSFDIAYYSKQDAKSPHIRGNIRRITDHSGSALDFEYYRDGNLLRLTQKGGQKADGSPLADRSFVFTYTTSSGDGPAIAQELDRRNPDATTSNQSTRLYSVRQPRELADRAREETLFTYLGPGHGVDRWKLATRSDRTGATTNYSYDIQTKTTTVALPEGQAGQSRTSKFVYDGQGKVTKITDPRNEDTLVEWSPDRHVTKVTFVPTGRFTRYDYNANGYLTKQITQGGVEPTLVDEVTELSYEDRPVTAQDFDGYWKPGRSVPHTSLLKKVVTPNGSATSDPADFDWNFQYDQAGNLTQATDPENHSSVYLPNPDGTMATISDPNGHVTAFESYDANGLPTKIVEAKTTSDERTTLLGYSDDGLLQWIEDPNHVGQFSAYPAAERRSYFFYDSFHRLGRQSAPKSTALDRGNLIVSSADYDANDNLLTRADPYYSRGENGPEAPTTMTFDAMDRPLSVTDPAEPGSAQVAEKTTFGYDAAGRMTRERLPLGQDAADPNAYARDYKYDALDRVLRETQYVATGPLHQHYCYSDAGDVASVTRPKAGITDLSCPAAAGTAHTARFDYDAGHRLIKHTDALGHVSEQHYDLNGNIDWQKDAAGKQTTLSYDQRDLMVKAEQQAGLPDQATVASAYRYDPVGNLEQLVTPRAFDVHSEQLSYSGLDYVAEYSYDALNRLVKTTLPKHADSDEVIDTPVAYEHRAYDKAGNLTMVSLPTPVAEASQLSDPKQKTTLTYFDAGWIASSNEPGSGTPKVLFDYTAEGQQALRKVDGTTRRREWDYLADGQLRREVDVRNDNVQGSTAYTYDLNDNLKTVKDSTGLTQAMSTRAADITADYDLLDRVTRVTTAEAGRTRATTYEYDLNSNLTQRIDDITVAAGALDDSTGRKNEYIYDGADWLSRHDDFGEDRTSASDDRRVHSDWTVTGVQDLRRIEKWNGSGWTQKQKTDWDWSDNGLLLSLKTFKGAADAGDLLESHSISYTTDSGTYANGHRTKDVFRLNGPNSDCKDSDCTNEYVYNARDRLVKEIRGNRAPTIYYKLLPAGNVDWERTGDGAGARLEDYDYDGNRLIKQTVGGLVSEYYYDCLGLLTEITTEDGSQSDCGDDPSGTTVADYHYDEFDRLSNYKFFGGGTSVIDESEYDYDSLDRLLEQRERHARSADGGSKRVEFDYVGLTSDLASEKHFTNLEPNLEGGDEKTTKSYAYDPFGNRVGMTDDPAAAEKPTRSYGYGYDPHGSVSLLIDDAGEAKASYGYTAYGESDAGLTKEIDPDAPLEDPTRSTKPREPLNPYRYTGKRLDTGSAVATGETEEGSSTRAAGQGTIDMGARRFGPDVARFLQPDAYAGALADLGLSLDPLSQNRYSLAGGNPISFVEVDGHYLRLDGGGTASRSPTPSATASAGGGSATASAGTSGGGSSSGGSSSSSGAGSGQGGFARLQEDLSLARFDQSREVARGSALEFGLAELFGFATGGAAEPPEILGVDTDTQAWQGGTAWGSDASLFTIFGAIRKRAGSEAAERVITNSRPGSGAKLPQPGKTVVIGRGNVRERGLVRPGEQALDLPNLHNPRLNWQQNAGQLRAAIRQRLPVRDADPTDFSGFFLNAERYLLEQRGYMKDPRTHIYWPPGRR